MKILIIHTFGLGDMIMFSPALQSLQNSYSSAQIDFLIFQKVAAEPIKNCKNIGTIYYSSFGIKDIFSSIHVLRKNRYDISIVTSGTNPRKSWLFSLFIGAKQKIFDDASYIEESHRVENNLDLVAKIGLKHIIKIPRYCLDNNIQIDIPKTKMRIGIHHGSNAMYKSKRWSKENFVSLIGLLHSHFDCEVLVFGGPDEREESLYLQANSDIVLVENRSLAEVAHLISTCDIFINSDSGLGHIASCFDMPIFTIFGPAKMYKARPYNPRAVPISLQLECQPCYGKKNIVCNNECLMGLSPQTVFEEIIKNAK